MKTAPSRRTPRTRRLPRKTASGRSARTPTTTTDPLPPVSCCGPSRRSFLGAIGLAALLPAVGAVRPGPVDGQSNTIVAGDMELVTVPHRSAVLTRTTPA
ncbi:twin-arginine translocation signal domain-containing protein, partial [Nocardia cyriacigeorgica]|uniref:twin-arginine translocation signal domain-containing protein n=1 Tax=Nocardia cyriacigeorgica TaxID=135487 RepID=UPI002458E0F9